MTAAPHSNLSLVSRSPYSAYSSLFMSCFVAEICRTWLEFEMSMSHLVHFDSFTHICEYLLCMMGHPEEIRRVLQELAPRERSSNNV